MSFWNALKTLVNAELSQAVEEGREPQQIEALRNEVAAAGDDEAKLRAAWKKILEVPQRADWNFDEPSDLATIRARRSDGPRRFAREFSDDELQDKMHGAWLGRCAGCALGKPVEAFMGEYNGLSSRERIKRYLQAIGENEYPLNFYFPAHSPAENETGTLICPPSTREEIAFMETDDDIRYTVLGQLILRENGRDFTTGDVARAWLHNLPYGLVFTAEAAAYRNIAVRYDFNSLPKSEDDNLDWNWIATHENPYREWIGAQIRVDSWGYAAPGNPELAADFAWRDARLSHIKNGIYGAMFCSALISAAFVCNNAREAIEAALSEIPQTSRLHSDIRQTMETCAQFGDDKKNFEPVLADIYARLGHLHAVHTNNNAAIVVAALILAGDDFESAISIAVMGGMDSDCNGATVGSIFGAMYGAHSLPEKWMAPLNDTLHSGIIGYDPISIAECARRSAKIAREIASA